MLLLAPVETGVVHLAKAVPISPIPFEDYIEAVIQKTM